MVFNGELMIFNEHELIDHSRQRMVKRLRARRGTAGGGHGISLGATVAYYHGGGRVRAGGGFALMLLSVMWYHSGTPYSGDVGGGWVAAWERRAQAVAVSAYVS